MSEQKKEKKVKLTPEQVKKACDAMGNAANAVDNFYDNAKGTFGPMGKAVGAGVLITLVVALIANPVLVWILALMIAAGAAPMIRAKVIELKEAAEKAEKEKAEAASAEKEEEKK